MVSIDMLISFVRGKCMVLLWSVRCITVYVLEKEWRFWCERVIVTHHFPQMMNEWVQTNPVKITHATFTCMYLLFPWLQLAQGIFVCPVNVTHPTHPLDILLFLSTFLHLVWTIFYQWTLLRPTAGLSQSVWIMVWAGTSLASLYKGLHPKGWDHSLLAKGSFKERNRWSTGIVDYF